MSQTRACGKWNAYKEKKKEVGEEEKKMRWEKKKNVPQTQVHQVKWVRWLMHPPYAWTAKGKRKQKIKLKRNASTRVAAGKSKVYK